MEGPEASQEIYNGQEAAWESLKPAPVQLQLVKGPSLQGNKTLDVKFGFLEAY